MYTYISFLRGINVGGKRIIMKELKELYSSLGFVNVVTYIQSGNVIFSTKEKGSTLIHKIETNIQQTFGYEVKIVLRTIKDLQTTIDTNPFQKLLTFHREKIFSRLQVTFLRIDNPIKTPKNIKEGLKTVQAKSEEVYITDKEVFLYCPEGYGITKLSNKFIEKKFEVIATTRNWKTILALHQLAQS